MKKIVINACYGGFGLSHEAMMRYAEIKGINLVWKQDRSLKLYYNNLVCEQEQSMNLYYKDSVSDDNYFDDRDIPRDDPVLVQIVEELGHDADGYYANLKIVEIPDDVEWHIAEYDGGSEHVAENHRKWW